MTTFSTIHGSPNRYASRFDGLNDTLEITDRFTTAVYYGLKVGEYVANRSDGDKLNATANVFGYLRTGLSTLRGLTSLGELLSGRMFWEWDKKMNNWKRDESGNYVRRSLPTIIARMCIAVGRWMGTINLLVKCEIIDLGKHAKGFNHAIVAVWGVVVSVYFSLALFNLIEAFGPRDPEKTDAEVRANKREAVSLMIISIADLLLVVDCSVVGDIMKSENPAWPIAGAASVAIGNLLYAIHTLFFDLGDTMDKTYAFKEGFRRSAAFPSFDDSNPDLTVEDT